MDETREHDVVFDKIKEEIIQGIRNSKYWIDRIEDIGKKPKILLI